MTLANAFQLLPLRSFSVKPAPGWTQCFLRSADGHLSIDTRFSQADRGLKSKPKERTPGQHMDISGQHRAISGQHGVLLGQTLGPLRLTEPPLGPKESLLRLIEDHQVLETHTGKSLCR